MRYPLGRFLQILGLAVVGTGLVVGLLKDDLRYEARMLGAGGLVFLLGWLVVRPFRAR